MKTSEKQFDGFLWLIDELQDGEKIYLLAEKLLSHQMHESSVAELDECADLLGITPDSQLRVTDWVTAELSKWINEEHRAAPKVFAHAMMHVLDFASQNMMVEKVAQAICDHKAKDFALRGPAFGLLKLKPDDGAVVHRINRLIISAIINRIRRMSISFDGQDATALMRVQYTDDQEREFDFVPMRVSALFYHSLMARLKLLGRLISDSALKSIDPFHHSQLHGTCELMIHDSSVQLAISIHGHGNMSPETAEIEFGFPQGYPPRRPDK